MAYSHEYVGNASSLLPENIKTFYFVRHGKTDWNALSLAQGSQNIPLNETGREQARAINPILARLSIELVVASPLSRALETAELGTSGLGLDIVVDPRLQERSFGPYEGTAPPKKLFTSDFEGCEPTQDFSRRVASALAHCCDKGRLLVAHGGVLCVILSLLGTNVDEHSLSNACVLQFEKANSQWRVTNLSSPEP